MHIKEILSQGRTTLSFEFFPPKTAEAVEVLFGHIQELETLRPDFVSVTYGAGGSTRDLTHDLVVRLKKETSLDPIPHLTCVCHQEKEIAEILERYAAAEVSNILALGGDPPVSMANYDRSQDSFRQAADLVKYIQRFNRDQKHPQQEGFGIGVAGFPEGHPQTPNRLKEMDYFKAKIDAGADYICTQLFLDNHEFYDFRERCELAQIHVPIIAGIMPVLSLANMKRMAELSGGTRFPAKLLRALQRCNQDEAAMERVGIHYATEQCSDLLNQKVDGIHFYTLNKSEATREIYSQLGINSSANISV
jgi:methylenetetrahydrofolate reductase (NADPH)